MSLEGVPMAVLLAKKAREVVDKVIEPQVDGNAQYMLETRKRWL
jgi:hypothetical protein